MTEKVNVPNNTGNVAGASEAQNNVEVERKFLPSPTTRDKLKSLGGRLVDRQTFQDVYYDTPEHKLMLHNHWLRSRAGRWELKYATTGQDAGDLNTKYFELDQESDILSHLSRTLNFPKLPTVDELSQKSICKAVVTLETHRETYAVDSSGPINVVLDSTDFGYEVGEIEMIVPSEERISDALNKIDEFAKQLDFDDVHKMELPPPPATVAVPVV